MLKFWFFYITAILLNAFLLLPVAFYPLFFVPLHMLICYIMFNRVLEFKEAITIFGGTLFSLIPALTQIIFLLLYFTITENISEVFVLIVVGALFSLIEFMLIKYVYEKALKKGNN